jgi:phage-related protein
VRDYINNLDASQQTQLFSLFDRILGHGPPKNERKFKNIGNQIYELKTRSGVRILCFYGGAFLPKSLILTHGFSKPGKKVLRREKEKAINWRKDYFENAEII